MTATRPWLGLAARLVVGGVWLYAGAIKLPDPAQSVAAVRAYQAAPVRLVAPVGQLLPVVEVVIGAMLVLGLLTRGAAVVSAVLLVVFIVGIVSVWVRGIEIDCGCFGGGGYDPDATSKYPWEIARDAALSSLLDLPRSRLRTTRLSTTTHDCSEVLTMSTKNKQAPRRARRCPARRAGARREAPAHRSPWPAIVLGLVLVVAVGFGVNRVRDTTNDVTARAPRRRTYGVSIGPADAPHEVVIYEDFLCPLCGELEAATSDDARRRWPRTARCG